MEIDYESFGEEKMVAKTKKIWVDGKFVDWDRATVHVLSHTLHYGVGAFEGIRCYQTDQGKSAVFRLEEHVDRLFDSIHILTLKIPFSRKRIREAIRETLRVNRLKKGYIRPVVFIGMGDMGLFVKTNPIHTVIAVWPWGAYLGDDGLLKGIRAKVSSFNRHHVNAAMTKAKVNGTYVNSVLAKWEVVKAGYDEAILLDTEGYISEASGENIFMVKGGVIKTTPLTSVLAGITRNSIITIAKDLGYEVVETRFTRDELYTADEVFFTGTAAEITPVREIDDRKVGRGKPGKVTKALQSTFFDIVHGKEDRYASWLDFV